MSNDFPTPIQDIALNLIFTVLGERRWNRTAAEYAAIGAKLPGLKELVFKVNELLSWIHSLSRRSGVPLPQLCRFQAGDARWEYEDYPRIILYQTVRTALNVSGLRNPRWHKHLK
jgi:hypothetical protein